MIYAARDANLITGFCPASSAPVITHLQFANDTFLFGAAEENEVKNMIVVIRCYGTISELKVYVSKSSLIGYL